MICNRAMSIFDDYFLLKIFQGLNPGRAIAEIKKLLSGIAKKEDPKIDTMGA